MARIPSGIRWHWSAFIREGRTGQNSLAHGLDWPEVPQEQSAFPLEQVGTGQTSFGRGRDCQNSYNAVRLVRILLEVGGIGQNFLKSGWNLSE